MTVATIEAVLLLGVKSNVPAPRTSLKVYTPVPTGAVTSKPKAPEPPANIGLISHSTTPPFSEQPSPPANDHPDGNGISTTALETILLPLLVTVPFIVNGAPETTNTVDASSARLTSTDSKRAETPDA